MLSPYIKDSNIIELVSEDTNEDSSMYKAVLRIVGDPASWSSLIVKILRTPDDDSEYLVSVRKEYYLSEENTPSFCWVLVVWGDMFEAFSELGPLLQSTRPTAPSVAVTSPAGPSPSPSTLNKRVSREGDGVRTITSVPLPFKRGSRDNSGKTKTLGSRGLGAYVSNVTSDGGI